MLALLEVDNIEQWSEVIMQLTTILYLKIYVYDDILQIYRDVWTNFKLSKTKSLHSRIYLLNSQKVKYLKYLIKLFTYTSTVCKLTSFDLQDFKNGRFQRAVRRLPRIHLPKDIFRRFIDLLSDEDQALSL
jgi:hypothetical protein